jgi:hypothetical protein
MLTVADVLFRAFGKKCIIIGMQQPFVSNLTVCFIYLVIHTTVLSLELLVIEVAFNSGTKTLLLLIVSAAFVELKISVLKKCDEMFV